MATSIISSGLRHELRRTMRLWLYSPRYFSASSCCHSYSSTTNRRQTGADLAEHGIRGYIGDFPVFASATSETKYNIISEAVARDFNLKIRPLSKSFITGDGKKTKAIGSVFLEWQFEGEVKHDSMVEFLVLPNCSKPVTLGHEFLESTGTMTINWHRLKTKLTSEEQIPCIQILGEPPLSIAGRIHNQATHALPASGCEINIISGRYLVSRGLHRKIDTSNKDWVKLTNGKLVETAGEIHSRWAFGTEKWLDVWPIKFSVLPDCPYDVVLGRPFLYAADAFLRYSECFERTAPTSSDRLRGGVCVAPFILRPFMRKPGIRDAVKRTGDSSVLEELKRRAAADHAISKKTDLARLMAYEAEQKRRSMWNDGRPSSTNSSDLDDDNTSSAPNESSTSTNESSQGDVPSVHDHSLLAEQRGSFNDHSQSWLSSVSEYHDYSHD